MRTIKFRGKRKDNNEWIQGDLAYMFGVIPCIMFKNRFSSSEFDGVEIGDNEVMLGGFIEVIPKTIGQFTGLYDKHGKEIYEGDIVNLSKDGKEISEVFFNRGCFYVRVNSIDYRLSNFERFRRKIIGNIHDNPELLK